MRRRRCVHEWRLVLVGGQGGLLGGLPLCITSTHLALRAAAPSKPFPAAALALATAALAATALASS